MKQRRIKEGVCILVLLIFVILLMTQEKQSTAEPQAVFEAVQSAMDVDGLAVCKDERIKKEFGIDPRAFDFVGYFASDSIMEVREILLVHLSEESGEQELLDKITSRVTDKAELFSGYAPEQSGYLEKYELLSRGGYVLFTVSDTPDDVVRAFKKAI